MRKIEKNKIRLKKHHGSALFHDSRHDIHVLTDVVAEIIKKQNEIIDALNSLSNSEQKVEMKMTTEELIERIKEGIKE